MNCNETQNLLAAHLDGELDVVRDAEVIAHLDGCQACAEAALAHAARRGLIRDKLPRYPAPAGLDAQILAAIRPVTRPTSASPAQKIGRLFLPLAALLAIGIFVGFEMGVARTRGRARVDELISAHVRAAMTDHVMEVISTDQHTVKPWFAGKLDYSPPVHDLAAEGFPLVGGRLDRIGGRTVAVLVYQRRKHFIDVFVAPLELDWGKDDGNQAGFNLVNWTQSDQHCVAVSDLAANELKDFSRLLEKAAQ